MASEGEQIARFRMFGERMLAAKDEFKARYGEFPDYIDQYWFALIGRCPTERERGLIEKAGLIGKDEKLPSEKQGAFESLDDFLGREESDDIDKR